MICYKCGADAISLTFRGFMCESCDAASEKVCDFCVRRAPAWVYPAQDFTTTEISYSKGGWAACELCHDLIERRQFVQLCDRSLKSFFRRHPVTRRKKKYIRSEIARMHNDFRSHRAGEPYRIDH